jgi:hypothetical protein
MLQLEVHDSACEPEVVRVGDAVTVHFHIRTDPRQIPGLTEAERELVHALWGDDSAGRSMAVTGAGTLVVQPRTSMEDGPRN